MPDLQAELLSFPTGRHDDQVDVFGLVGQLLDRISGRLVGGHHIFEKKDANVPAKP